MMNKKYEFNQKEVLELELVRLKRNIRKINEEYGYLKNLIYDYIMRTTDLKLHDLVMEVDDRLVDEYFESFVNIYSQDFSQMLELDGIETHQVGSSMRFTSGYLTRSLPELERYFNIDSPVGFFALLDEVFTDCLYTGDIYNFITDDIKNSRVRTIDEVTKVSDKDLKELVGDLQEINEVLEYEYFEDEYLHEVINDEIVALKNVWDIIDGFLNNQVEIFYDFIGLEV